MNAIILEKVHAHYPRLRGLVRNYRNRHEVAVAQAIADAVLNSDNRWFDRHEILYLANIKADADRRMRSAHENLELRIKHARRMRSVDPLAAEEAEAPPKRKYERRGASEAPRFYVVR